MMMMMVVVAAEELIMLKRLWRVSDIVLLTVCVCTVQSGWVWVFVVVGVCLVGLC